MAEKEFNVRSEILATIAKTSDQTMRTVLLLMLGVLDDIGSKLDTVMKDERALKESVLNGHASSHDEHHRWIAGKINAEEEAAKVKKTLWQKFIEGAAAHAGSLIVGAVIAWALLRFNGN